MEQHWGMAGKSGTDVRLGRISIPNVVGGGGSYGSNGVYTRGPTPDQFYANAGNAILSAFCWATQANYCAVRTCPLPRAIRRTAAADVRADSGRRQPAETVPAVARASVPYLTCAVRSAPEIQTR